MFWNRHDLVRQLDDFQVFCNAVRVHTSLDDKTLSNIAGFKTGGRAEFNDTCWIFHCCGLVQLPMAA